MLNSISWQEFLFATSMLVGAYYIITGLLLFSKEIINIFNQRKPNTIAGPHNENQLDANESNSLMGKARFETREKNNVPREERIHADDLHVAPLIEIEEPISNASSPISEQTIIQLVATAMQEITTLIEVARSGSKEECISFFVSLLEQYPNLVGTKMQGVVTLFIYTSCKEQSAFDFEHEEINAWWPISEISSNNSQ